MHKLQVMAGDETAPAILGDVMEIAGGCASNPLTQITRSSWSNPATVPCSTQPSTSTSPPTTTMLQILEEAVAALKKTNANFLASHMPTTSSDPTPCHTSCSQHGMSGPINTRKVALTIEPQTTNELLLLSALHESESHLHQIEVHTFKLQASNILNEAYTSRLKNQLAMWEEKKKVIKLVRDGSPRHLTADDFYELAKEKETEVQDEARWKGEWKEVRELYKEAVAVWKVADEKRKKDVMDAKAKNKKALNAFIKKKDAAKKASKKFTTTKPTPLPVPKAIPKPKLKDFAWESDVVNAGEDSGQDDGEDFEASEGGSNEDAEDDDDDD